MADDSFVGKKVTVRFEVLNIAAWEGKVIADDEKGITLRRDYRRGVRDELIPRDQIRGVFHEVEKGPRHTQGAKGSTASELDESKDLDETGDLDETEDSDNDGLDDSGLPDTEWDDDE